MINEVKLQNPAGFADATCEAKIGFGRGRVSAYAAYGITGVIPYPVLCRMVTGFACEASLFEYRMRHKTEEVDCRYRGILRWVGAN